MEFVKFVLCMSIIALANGASLINSNRHYKFDVPELGRGGFEMILNATISKKVEKELDNRALAVKFNIDDGGLHIYIIQEKEEAISMRFGDIQLSTVALRLKVVKEDEDKKLFRLQVFLDDGFQNEEVATFDKLQHISVEGVIEDVNHLCFNFTNENVSCI